MECNKCHKDTKICSCSSSTTIGSPVQGPKGDKGDRGSRILTGEGAPSKALGYEGDFYLDTVTNNFYVKNAFCEWELKGSIGGTAGPQGEQGEQGVAGADGANGANGADGREIELQSNGSFIQWRYVGDLGWVDLIELSTLQGPQGDQGDQGCSLLQGSGVPSSLLGKDCDSYIDLSTADIYLKASGSWVKTGNIGFETGLDGPEGNFSAESTVNQIVPYNNILPDWETEGLKLVFLNDSTSGRYDYGNDFLTSNWVAPFDATDVKFNYNIEFAGTSPAPGLSVIWVALLKDLGATVATLVDLESVDISALSTTNISKTIVVPTVLEGESYYIKVAHSDSSQIWEAVSGSSFWNELT
jgi:hypothetical protein